MNPQHILASALLIAAIVFTASSTSLAVPTEYQDSAAFTYRYDFGSVDPGNPAHIDLDGNNLPDLEPWQSPTLNPTAGTVELDLSGNYADAYLNLDPAAGSIWHNTDIDADSGYTIEVRARAGTPKTGNVYSSGIVATANGSNNEFWLIYGPDGQSAGGYGDIDLGQNVNDDDFHTFRIASEPGSTAYWVWRDGQLLNPGTAPLSHTASNVPRMAFGGIGGDCLGQSSYDYFRFTPGAYLPPGADPIPVPPPAPIEVEKELYLAHTETGVGLWVTAREITPQIREEIHYEQSTSDTPKAGRRRRSSDNGATWSDFDTMPDPVFYEAGKRIYWGPWPQTYDPTTEKNISVWLRQTDKTYNQCFVRTSHDLGLTWGDAEMLMYEPGDDFDPADPLNPDFLTNNRAYFGQSILCHSNGTLIFPAAGANDPGNSSSQMSSLCFIGQWDANAQEYNWSAGDRVTITPDISSRGLMEPDLTELEDGRVLVIWRGSNTSTTPGRKWFSVSDDGGQTLSAVQELKYDDGDSFYSPSSYHRLIRHSVTDKLYWIGNITPSAPSGNSPRYPLVIAEVDEENVALLRDTVTVIDDRQYGDSSSVQLSNFSVLENRDTHEFEIYLMRLGADPADFWGSDSYKYTLGFNNCSIPGDANCDGNVDVSDLGILATNYGATGNLGWFDADFTADGLVDVSDLGILATNYGTSATSSVPEPSIAVMLLGLLCAFAMLKVRD